MNPNNPTRPLFHGTPDTEAALAAQGLRPAIPFREKKPVVPVMSAGTAQQLLTCADDAKAVAAEHINDPWGTFTTAGGELKVRHLCDLDTSHLENIIITQRHIPYETSAAILLLLKQRYNREGFEAADK